MRMSHGRSTVHARAAARRHGLMATLLLTVVLASPAAVLGPYRLDLPKPGAYNHIGDVDGHGGKLYVPMQRDDIREKATRR